MSSQKLVYTFLIIASILGLSFIFVRRFSEARCPQNDTNLCAFLRKNKTIAGEDLQGTYEYVKEDLEMQIDWVKKGEMSSINIKKGEKEILDAIFGPRYVYLKDDGDSKWWREEKNRVESTLAELPFYPETFFSSFGQLLQDSETTFVPLTDVPCGDQSCFRYQVQNPKQDSQDQVFIVFSKDTFQLRTSMIVHAKERGNLSVSYDPIPISEPEDIKIVAAGKNIFIEYMDRRDSEEPKTFEYVEQFQKQRLESEGSTTIEYVDNTPTPEPSISP